MEMAVLRSPSGFLGYVVSSVNVWKDRRSDRSPHLHVWRAPLCDGGPRTLRSGIYTMLSRKLSLLQEMASVLMAHGGLPWSQCRVQDYIDAWWLVQRLCTSSILLPQATAAACNKFRY